MHFSVFLLEIKRSGFGYKDFYTTAEALRAFRGRSLPLSEGRKKGAVRTLIFSGLKAFTGIFSAGKVTAEKKQGQRR